MSAPSVTRSHYEIHRYRNGEFVGLPIPCATLKEAQEESAYMARGNLNQKGDREPGLSVYELAGDEAPPEENCLVIKSVTTRTEATVIF